MLLTGEAKPVSVQEDENTLPGHCNTSKGSGYWSRVAHRQWTSCSPTMLLANRFVAIRFSALEHQQNGANRIQSQGLGGLALKQTDLATGEGRFLHVGHSLFR